MKKLKLRPEAGFTLVEVLIAMGLLSVVTLGTIQVMSNIDDGQRRLFQVMNIMSMHSDVENSLRNLGGCLRTLGKNPAAPAVPPNPAGPNYDIPESDATPVAMAQGIINNNNQTVVPPPAPTSTYGSGGGRLQITNIELRSNVSNVLNQAKDAVVRISFRRLLPTGDWGLPTNMDFPVTVIPDADGAGAKVGRCYTADPSSQVCAALGGAYLNSRCTLIDLTNNPGGVLVRGQIESQNGAVVAAGNVQSGATVSGSTVTSSGAITATGGGPISTAGLVQGGTVNSTGNMTATATVQGATVHATGDVTAAVNVQPSGNICPNGNCVTAFRNPNNQICPQWGQDPRCTNVVGLTNEGRIICGAHRWEPDNVAGGGAPIGPPVVCPGNPNW